MEGQGGGDIMKAVGILTATSGEFSEICGKVEWVQGVVFVGSLACAGVVLYGIVVILIYMQDVDENEESIGFVGRPCERIHNWEFRHPRIARPCQYFALLVVVLGFCHWAFNYFDLYHTDADSARYMLSAMVQAQAAIVAIVITLTLIAVQLTASAYSPRVIRVFKNNPDMWLLLCFYGLSMLYGLIVLKMVEGVAGEVVSQDVFWFLGFVFMSFERCVSLAYWFGVFTLVALFPYMRNTIDLLKPENIINRLALEITKDNILNSEKYPIQPIMDIIHGSVMKYDIATTRIGLKAVTNRVIEIIDSDSQEEISTCFCDHLERVSTLTVNKMDEESTAEAIKNLDNFGKLTAEREFESAASGAAWSLGFVGKIAAERGFERETNQVAQSLENIGETAAEKKLEVATFQAVLFLGIIVADAAERGLERTTKQAAHSIGNVGKAAAENGLESETLQAVELLRTIGLESAVSEAAWSLVYVGIAAAKKEIEYAAKQAAQFLAELAISSEGHAKTAIEHHRLASRGEDQKFFDSFMNLYEHELEELRTRNSN